jgi:hypothetical protein
MGLQAHLTWQAPADTDIVGYEVWKSVNGGTFTKIHSGVVVGTFYCDGPLTPNQQVCYQIRSVDNTPQEVP